MPKRQSRNDTQEIHGLRNKASEFFRTGKWRLAVDTYDQLFELQPTMVIRCVNEYWDSISNCLQTLTAPHFNMKIFSKSKDQTIGFAKGKCMTKDLNTKHLTKYKLIKKYYKARIRFLDKCKQFHLNDYARLASVAITEYLFMLQTYDDSFRRQYKYMQKLQVCNNGHLLHYSTHLHSLIRKGQFYYAQKLMEFVARNFTFDFDALSDILIKLLQCYMYCRLCQYNECLRRWTEVETKYDHKTIFAMLFPLNVSKNKLSRSRLFPRGIRNVCYFPNTIILHFKLECYIELKQYKNARNLCNFYYDLWGREDQTVFYDGYLDLRMGKLADANMKLRYIPPNVWKQNQHYFAGLFYCELGEFDHAKYHFVCAEYAEDFGFYIAEHFITLSCTLMQCQEWKLSKLFLRKANKLTPAIQTAHLMDILNDKVGELRCGNIECLAKESDILKLKICKGCGKAVYCSRRCQKLHWKIHRMECDNSWSDLFEMMSTRKYIECPYDNHI